MNGLIVLNKPLNISSHDAVFKVKKILKEKKVGHTGTLDPLASGILIICVGSATKLSQYLTTDTKSYRAKIMLGLSTKTYDLEGEIEQECDVNIQEDLIDKTIESFIGKSMQYPPLYSAIKKDGKKLYEYALKGEEVEVEPREIEVFSAKRISPITYENNKVLFEVDFNVSKGTYIRSIASDFGKKIGVPSVLAGLVRHECSGFTLEDACTLEDVAQNNFNLISPLDALKDYLFVSDENSINKAKNGMKISYRYIKDLYNDTPLKFVVTDNEKLIAIYKLSFNEELKTSYYKADTVWN
mgnify:CR=1 FL=1